jgi:Tfp pilus assembly protein PilP
VTVSRHLIPIVIAVAAAAAPGALVAQSPGAAPQAAAPAAAPAPAPEIFSYRAEGRRDPFVNLLSRGTGPQAAPARVDGPAGLAVAEISVRGVLQTPAGFVAMVQGADTKTYLVRPQQRLLDGTITDITAQGLVIVQKVTDPLSPVKTREVRKGLRSPEEGT